MSNFAPRVPQSTEQGDDNINPVQGDSIDEADQAEIVGAEVVTPNQFREEFVQ